MMYWFLAIGVVLLVLTILKRKTVKAFSKKLYCFFISFSSGLITVGIADAITYYYVLHSNLPEDLFPTMLVNAILISLGFAVCILMFISDKGLSSKDVGIIVVMTFAIYFIGYITVVPWTWDDVYKHYNIEIVRTKDCAMNTQKYELESFCGVPAQKTNGYISGSSTLGSGNVEGKVTTHDEVWYWYYKEDGIAYYNSVPSNHCIKKFLSDDTAPYVEVIDLGIQIKKINRTDGTEEVSYQSQNWTTYIFHFPEELKGNFK